MDRAQLPLPPRYNVLRFQIDQRRLRNVSGGRSAEFTVTLVPFVISAKPRATTTCPVFMIPWVSYVKNIWIRDVAYVKERLE
jgi:hypothetical protein